MKADRDGTFIAEGCQLPEASVLAARWLSSADVQSTSEKMRTDNIRSRDVKSHCLFARPRPRAFSINILHNLILNSPQDIPPLLIFRPVDINSDVDQESIVKFRCFILLLKNNSCFFIAELKTFGEDVPYFRNNRHHALFDSIVYHLDIMS